MWPLNTELRIKRTLYGAEIDKIILELEACKALAAEHRRRADWRKCELSANSLKTEYGHARARRRLILFMIGWTNSFVLDRLPADVPGFDDLKAPGAKGSRGFLTNRSSD